ncbi:MAG TPA: anaerobic ribonucleoside-triphosphate reductase activating protein, partial [Erysipelotrichaceae bacterium]|nr:anaerobic ribonucleoside-triphosphate reductase activating protein [Erysipelotrichaceae bacterium]
WLQGAKHYYLQQYQNSGNVIAPAGLASYSASEMATLLKAVQEFIPQAELRGVK